MSSKLGFEDLKKTVISNGICTGCSACVASCPYKGVLDYADEKPKLIGECKFCGICLRICPRYNPNTCEISEVLFRHHTKLEEFLGAYLSINVARATDPATRRYGQDGAVATAITLSALESRIIDGALLTETTSEKPWFPKPTIVKTREEVLRCAGTKYCYSPLFLFLKNIFDQGLRRILFVGTPCQILAYRRMQKANLRRLIDPIALCIGLFCSESFDYQGLFIEKLQGSLGIDLHDIEKINIKGRMHISLKNGTTLDIPLKEARIYARSACRFCDDFSSELADLSLGGVGLDGWTLTIIRTEQGQRFYDMALTCGAIEAKPIDECHSALELLRRLSLLKKKNAQKRNC